LSSIWTPYFEEIRQRTKSIQNKLKKEWYENIDLQLKSLFIDWIEFFLNLDTEEPQLDNKKWLYLKWLFDSLMINTGNKKLLKNILSELKNWWEKLPPSPLKFLVYGKSQKKEYSMIDWRCKWKEIMKWHCAFNDSPDQVGINKEDVVIYHVWDEYIPLSYYWNSINLLHKIQLSSFDELVEMFLEDQKDYGKYFDITKMWETRKAIITYIKNYFLIKERINLEWMYEKWDRFKIVRGTYNDKQPLGDKEISCWYVNVISEKTWKVYRVLSV
jgi:hypothetical protein